MEGRGQKLLKNLDALYGRPLPNLMPLLEGLGIYVHSAEKNKHCTINQICEGISEKYVFYVCISENITPFNVFMCLYLVP